MTEPHTRKDVLDAPEMSLAAALGGERRPNVFLGFEGGRNRTQLTDWLDEKAVVSDRTTPESIDESADLCIVDRRFLRRHRSALTAHKESVTPAFFPVVLVERDDAEQDPSTWSVVDEVILVPVRRAVMHTRLYNLLSRRYHTQQLIEREAELESALTELRLKDRAIADAPIGISITGSYDDDNPLVYVNEQFVEMTGSPREEVLGKNCRLLQGERTDPRAVERMSEAIAAAEPVSVDVVNYTRDGERFWNKVDIAPVNDAEGRVTHFIGFQTDITDRKMREQRLTVLNRLLRHNLRNEVNIIEGYLDVVEEGSAVDRNEAGESIRRAVRRMQFIGNEVSHVERVFGSAPSVDVTISVKTLLERIRGNIIDRHSDVEVEIDLESDAAETHLSSGPLTVGCVDYLEMLLLYNDREKKRLSISATVDEERNVVEIRLADNGDGLPEFQWKVVDSGGETPLQHTDRLGLWVLRWAMTSVGGELLFTQGQDDEPAHIRVQCPIYTPSTVSERVGDE